MHDTKNSDNFSIVQVDYKRKVFPKKEVKLVTIFSKKPTQAIMARLKDPEYKNEKIKTTILMVNIKPKPTKKICNSSRSRASPVNRPTSLIGPKCQIKLRDFTS